MWNNEPIEAVDPLWDEEPRSARKPPVSKAVPKPTFSLKPSDGERVADTLDAAKAAVMTAELELSKRHAQHPHPEIPAPPELAELGPRAYVRKRLEDLTPYLLEARIYRLRYGEDHERAKVEEELLDRAGFTRKPDGLEAGNRQVIVVNNIVNPYAQANPETEALKVVDVQALPAAGSPLATGGDGTGSGMPDDHVDD